MVKMLLLFAVLGIVLYAYLGHKTIAGTVTALYDDAKITFQAPASPGDNNGDALIAPAFASTNY